jgi:hypothetical protein
MRPPLTPGLSPWRAEGGKQKPKPGVNPAYDELQLTRLCETASGEHFIQPFALGIVVASDQHLVAGGSRVQFIPQLADIAAESFDRFDSQVARCLFRGAW